ncbi:MAG: hypothetical protein PF961_19215 [Planctomycetota bacterium]|nr:hypothetical protein [Planctomycetota bacterium]
MHDRTGPNRGFFGYSLDSLARDEWVPVVLKLEQMTATLGEPHPPDLGAAIDSFSIMATGSPVSIRSFSFR